MTGHSETSGLPAPQRLALVFFGGTIGSALRAGLGLLAQVLAVPGAVSFPIATMTINVVGAFLLGYAGETIEKGSAPSRRKEALRVGLGSGVLGGFTTYSALCADAVSLASVSPVVALLYAGGTLVSGVVASWIGITIVARRHNRRADHGGSDPLIEGSP